MMFFFFFKQKTAYEMRISDWEFRRVLFRSAPVLARPQAQAVAPVQDPEHGLQEVVSVCPSAGDAQEQVQLGRGRPGGPAVGHGTAHASTTSLTRAVPRSAVIRIGSHGAATEDRKSTRLNSSH